MGRKPNQWARVTEADEIVKALFEKHPTILWAVKPECIAVWGIENKEKSEKNTVLAQIKPIKGVEKAIFQNSSIPTRYIISLYWSDWNQWSMKFKKAVLFHELLHVHPDYEKTVKHDIEDFKIIVDALGVNWSVDNEDLPDLTNDDVKFNIALRPKVEDYDDEENDEIDGEEKKPKKRGRKPKAKAEDGETGETGETGEDASEKEKPKKVDVEVVEDGEGNEEGVEEDEDDEDEEDEGENEDKAT